VPQHDDVEFLKFLRPSAQSRELEKPAKHPVAQRHDHDSSCGSQTMAQLYRRPCRIRLGRPWGHRDRIRIYAPFRSKSDR
jgi:hypothetical protein